MASSSTSSRPPVSLAGNRTTDLADARNVCFVAAACHQNQESDQQSDQGERPSQSRLHDNRNDHRLAFRALTDELARSTTHLALQGLDVANPVCKRRFDDR